MEFENERIQAVNVPELDEFEKAKAKKVILSYFKKFSRLIHPDFTLLIHFKEYEKSGNRKKVVVNSRISMVGRSINAEQVDWNALKALRSSLATLEREITKKLLKKRKKKPKKED